MLLTVNVDVKIYSKNINYYKNLGYLNIKNNDIINIPIDNLSKGSHIIVSVKCDVCGKIKNITYQKYIANINRQNYYSCSQKCGNNKRINTNINKYGVDYLIKNDDIKNKIKKTNILKYGVSNPFQSIECKIKIKETCIKKYGYLYPMQNIDIKNKSLRNRFLKIVKNDEHFKIYKNNVRRLTNRNKKYLYRIWNGHDFYDNEYIKQNFNLNYNNPDYPTLDHKIPVTYGFINKISPDEIANIENLCITKRKINSSKNNKLNYTI